MYNGWTISKSTEMDYSTCRSRRFSYRTDQTVGEEPSGALEDLWVRREKLRESFPDNRLIRDNSSQRGELIWASVSETVDIGNASNSEETSSINS
jgi:hypothetical protein